MVVGRLAPSPTGAQHLGNARTYLLAWLSARSQGGRVLLRIEDIDSPRIKPGAAEQAAADLRWLGLDWDAEPIVQTKRLPLYTAALDRLRAAELVYPCTCTRADVERAASAPHLEHEGPIYPGTCAGRSAADADRLEGQPFCWRFRLPATTPVFTDEVLGPIALDLHELGGDFVLWKAPRSGPHGETISASPAYQLAVVVDDAEQGVTEVVRGDDLVPSTPRQLLLYDALKWQPPRFTHVPLVVGLDGRRLAKRHGDTRLSAMRTAGVASEAVVGLLAWSCGWQAEPTPIAARELIGRFTLATLPREPFVVGPGLLARIGFHI